ncbi:MAG: UDP-N-acetyl-D-glucosamine dehydrogenase [Micromonosporaceae bacterium]|jgi:UDP-N-acetyl-D-glucosamine dehydrogenase|nr:UDP-N-acetyl-D-glucosamine dehydrogenase [Micromonosporaceae bacterium]MDT5038704.1 UDP-N-acetyl-D-glucosamine dehydrogenase [Micromonosporaceae bacterium]
MAKAQKVLLVGQGYVGLPLAMRAVEAGYDVVGVDCDVNRVKKLDAGESFVEDVSGERIQAALASGRYRASHDYADAAGFDICVITVPTPLREGIPDLSYIEESGRSIAAHVRPGCTVILESTTYPGTTDELLRPLIEDRTGLRAPEDFHLGYSPERIDPGNRTWRLENTPKVVSGIDAASLRSVEAFYGRLVERTVAVSSTRTAELTKLLENTFRHVNIALVNELAIFAGQLGVDVWEALDAASTKPFGFMPFRPGPGVGGHCLPIDPSYLSWQVKRTLGHQFRFIELANDINDRMPEHVVQRLIGGLNARRKPVNGSRMLVLGLAYKRNVGDCRESPAIGIAEALRKLGAQVRAVEPYAEPSQLPAGLTMVELSAAEIAAADAVVVLTDHDVFDYRLVERAARYVFDTRHRCSGDHVETI